MESLDCERWHDYPYHPRHAHLSFAIILKKPVGKSKTLLVVRGKLGDTLAAWPSVLDYSSRHPDELTYFAVRKSYASLFAGEHGVRLIPFASSAELFARLALLRFSGRFGKMAVLWGFGKQVPRIARLSGAPLRAYLDHRFGDAFNAIAPPDPDDFISDAAWRVIKQLDENVVRPRTLCLSGLRRRLNGLRRDVVCAAPVADELRRSMDLSTLNNLISAAKIRFPDNEIWIIGNPREKAFCELSCSEFPERVSLKIFTSIDDLVEILCRSHHLLTTDTGTYHLAASIGIPSTVFFGPTQPGSRILPDQMSVQPVRLHRLGEIHCEVKSCTRPHCLFSAVHWWAYGTDNLPAREQLPSGCLCIDEKQ